MRKCGTVDLPVPEFRLNLPKEEIDKMEQELISRNRKEFLKSKENKK